jgi:hypothetical protein
MRHLEFGLRRRFDGHHSLVLEASDAAEVLQTCDRNEVVIRMRAEAVFKRIFAPRLEARA